MALVGPDFDVLLRDGSTARIRLIRPEDATGVVAMHSRLSPESIRLRYFTPHPSLSDAEVERLTNHTGPDRLALVAERDEQLLAVAQYDRDPGEDEAEVAFLVDEAHHGIGLATILLEHLARAGWDRGITVFVASTLAENRAMLDVFAHSGFSLTTSVDEGIVNVRFPIAPGVRPERSPDSPG